MTRTHTPTHPHTHTHRHTHYCIWTCTPHYTNHLSLPPNHHTVLRWTNYGTGKSSNITHYTTTALPISEVTLSLKDHTASHNVQSFPQCFKSQSLMLSHHLSNALLTHLPLLVGGHTGTLEIEAHWTIMAAPCSHLSSLSPSPFHSFHPRHQCPVPASLRHILAEGNPLSCWAWPPTHANRASWYPHKLTNKQTN